MLQFIKKIKHVTIINQCYLTITSKKSYKLKIIYINNIKLLYFSITSH